MKKLGMICTLLCFFSMTACASQSGPSQQQPSESPQTEPVVEPFSAEYEMMGTTSAGLPKNDTFIFEGETTDGIITKLNFDIVRNKGLEDEYSKKDLMGYQMNVSDATISDTDGTLSLTLTMNGYEAEYGQYMMTGTVENLTADSLFQDMTVANYTGEVLDMDHALLIYQYLANESGITLSPDTPLSDLLAPFTELCSAEGYLTGTQRVSFAGYHGGRSYGEQIDAIVDYILANKMTLEEVYEMFRTVNQQSEPIEQRDTISGATIAFVGDFQRMVYLAIHGELFEGVTNHTTTDQETVVEVITQGFGGEIETHITFADETGKITAIAVRDAQESPEYGALLTADGSEFLQSLVAGQDDLEAIDVECGATNTATSLVKAVQLAQEYYAGLAQ